MFAKKRITVLQRPSVCPVCGAETVINEEILDGYGGGYYPWKCPGCGSSGEEHFEIQKNFTEHTDVVNAAGEPINQEDVSYASSQDKDVSVEAISDLLLKSCFLSLCNLVHYTFTPGQAREIATYLVDMGVVYGTSPRYVRWRYGLSYGI